MVSLVRRHLTSLRIKPTCILMSRESHQVNFVFCWLVLVLVMNLIRELLPNPLKNNHQCLATEFGWKLILFSFICSSGFPQPAYFDSLTTNAKSTPQLLSMHNIDIPYNIGWYIGASSVKSFSSISSIVPFHAFTPVLAHVTCASPRHEILVKYTERKINLKSI